MKIEIHLHNGKILTATVPDYNAIALAGEINDPKNVMIVAGDVLIHKNAVQMIIPVPAQ